MNPIPSEALRQIVSAAAQISTSIDRSPAGLAVEVAIENLMEAMDAYRFSRPPQKNPDAIGVA